MYIYSEDSSGGQDDLNVHCSEMPTCTFLIQWLKLVYYLELQIDHQTASFNQPKHGFQNCDQSNIVKG